MAPEFLVPSRFGLDRRTPSKEADVYAMAMTIYQVRSTRRTTRTRTPMLL